MYSKFTQINDSKQIVFVDAKMMSVITWALISSFTFPQLRWWAATNTMLIYSNLGEGFFLHMHMLHRLDKLHSALAVGRLKR